MPHKIRSVTHSAAERVAVLLMAMSSVAALGLTAPNQVTPQEQIKAACSGLSAPDWRERQKSFNALVELGMGGKISLTAPRDGIHVLMDRFPEMREVISTSLINLLQTEDNEVATGMALTPLERNFYSDVVMAVAGLHDPRSAKVLLGAVDTGNMAVAAAAGLGDATLKPALAMLSAATNRDDKLDMLVVLMQMAYPRNLAKLSPSSKTDLRAALIQATADKDAIVRRSGIEGLRALGDPTTIPVLEHVAQTDPETTGKPGALQYPIREFAKQAIIAIQKKAPA
jgi:hypothetical protein